MLDAIVIYITFYSELRRERRDHDRFPWPRKDRGFGARGILLDKYIFRQTCKIWIAADKMPMSKDAKNNRHLTHFKRELDRRVVFFLQPQKDRDVGATTRQIWITTDNTTMTKDA